MKKYTIEEIYDLFHRATAICYKGRFLWVSVRNKYAAYLTDDDGQEYYSTYEGILDDLNNHKGEINFYELKKIN